MQRRVPRTFWRFLMSYLSLMFLLVVMLFIANGMMGNINEKNSMKSSMNDLKNAAQEFEMRLEQMQAIVDMLAYDEDIIFRDLADDPVAAIAMQRKLRNYARSTLFLQDMLVYVDGIKTIYAASSTYSIDTYARRVLRYENWLPEDFARTVSNPGRILIRPMENAVTINGVHQELMTFVYKLNSNVSAGYASVLFQVHRPQMDAIMQKAVSSEKGNLLVLGSDDALLYALRAGEEDVLTGIQALHLADSESVIEKIGGQSLIVSTLALPNYGIALRSTIPVADALAQTSNLGQALNLALLLVMVIGVICILYFMRMNYLPIKRLGEVLRERGSAVQGKRGEVETAYEMIQDLHSQQENLRMHMLSKTAEMQDTLLTALLYGSISMAQYNALAEDYDYMVTFDHFRVVAIQASQMEPAGSEALFEEIIVLLEKTLFACEVRAVMQPPGRLFILIASGEEMEREICERIAQALTICALPEEGKVAAAVGCCYTSWLRIRDSYLEAERILRDQPLENGEVVCARQHTIYYPAYELNSLMQAMEKGEAEEFRQILRTICSMVERRLPLVTARMVGYDVLRMSMSALDEENPAIVALQGEMREQMASIMSSRDPADVSRILYQCGEKISLLIQAPSRPGREERMIEQVIAYIQEHFADANFSIQMVADAFSMRQNNLSQQFKRVTGQPPLQYVNHLRLEKGKELLAQSDLPLRVIATEVGFINESTFIRKFKATVGMTPGEYRRNIGKP